MEITVFRPEGCIEEGSILKGRRGFDICIGDVIIARHFSSIFKAVEYISEGMHYEVRLSNRQQIIHSGLGELADPTGSEPGLFLGSNPRAGAEKIRFIPPNPEQSHYCAEHIWLKDIKNNVFRCTSCPAKITFELAEQMTMTYIPRSHDEFTRLVGKISVS